MSDAGEPPALRASDSEREAAAERLRGAAGEGRLTFEELAARLDVAYTATTRGELERITADLPETVPEDAGGPPVRWAFGVLGGGNHRGRFRLAGRMTVINVMGGTDVDLREALIEGGRVEITVLSLMGGSDITVPEGVHVEIGGFALLGGNDSQVRGPKPAPGAPVVRVRAISIMGGTDVRTRRRP